MAEVWVGFILFVIAMLALDLGILGRRQETISMRAATAWSAVWISLALLFALGISLFWHHFHPDQADEGHHKAVEFLTGYIVELSLSVDNLFVFLVIFQYFGVPNHLRHRALMAGIIFAIVLRIAFIL